MAPRFGEAEARVVESVCASRELPMRMRALREHEAQFSEALVHAFAARSAEQARVDPGDALRSAETGLHVAEQLHADPLRAMCLRLVGEAQLVLGKHEDALAAFDSALTVLGESGDALAAAEIDALRVTALTHLERHYEATAAGERALALFEESGAAAHVVRTRVALGGIAFRRGHPRAALRHYRAAESWIPAEAKPTARGVIAMNRANALAAALRFRAAERQFAVAAEAFQDAGQDHTAAQVRYNAAYADVLRGRFRDALATYAKVEGVFLRLGDARHVAHVHLDRAEVLLAMGLGSDALQSAQTAAHRFAELGLDLECAQSHVFQAEALVQMGQTDRAITGFEQAACRFAHADSHAGRTHALVRLARMLLRRGDTQRARICLDEAASAPPANELARLSLELAWARLDLATGDATRALHRADGVRETHRHGAVPWIDIEARHLIGKAYAARGDHDQAVLGFRGAIRRLDAHRRAVPPDEHMAAYLARWSELFSDAVESLVAHGHVEMAFEFATRAKSRALTDRLAGGDAVDRPGVPSRRVRYLREKLNLVYRRLFRHMAGSEQLAVRALETNRSEALAIEAELGRDLRRAHADTVTQPAAFDAGPDLAAVQAALGPDTTFVDLFFTSNHLLLFIVEAGSIRLEVRDAEPAACRRLLDRLDGHLSLCESHGHERAEGLVPVTTAVLNELREAALGDALDGIETRCIVFSPHGPLHRLPFQALPRGAGWLADRFDISVVPNSAALLAAGRPASATGAPAVLGVPDPAAPHIADEAAAVGRLLDTQRVFIGSQATFAALREVAADAPIVHIATHGLVRPGEPMLSAVRLGDGWMNVYDAARLALPGSTLVLAACSSAMDAPRGAHELIGLTGALLRAGAGGVLSCQWRVDDAVTATWMRQFYTRLRETGEVAAAMRAATRGVRRAHPHPYYWAPFVLVGSANAGFLPSLRTATGERSDDASDRLGAEHDQRAVDPASRDVER